MTRHHIPYGRAFVEPSFNYNISKNRDAYAAGPYITPDTTISDAVASLPSKGGRIFLSEGQWSFNSLLDITRPNVHIISLCPGRTVLKRTAGGAQSMISLLGEESSIEGVRFVDPGATVASVTIAANRGAVRNCVFEDVGASVLVYAANWAEVSGNHIIENARDGVAFAGTCAYGMIANNRFEGSNASYNDVNLGSSVTSTVISGNVFEYSNGSILYEVSGNGMQTIAEIDGANSIDRGNIADRP